MSRKITLICILIYFVYSPLLISQTGWYQLNTGTNLNINCIHFLNANTGIAGADVGIILKTTNGGVNWIIISTAVFDPIKSVFISNTNVFLAGTDSLILRSTNAGANWNTTPVGGSKLSFVNSSTGFTISGYKTTNAGEAWLFYGFLITTNARHTIYFIDGSTGFTGATWWTMSFNLYNSMIGKTINNGVNWDFVYSSTLDINYRSVYDIYFPDNNNGFALEFFNTNSECRLLRSGNGGNNWTPSTLPMKMNSVKFTDNSTGWMCGISGNILYSTNGGTNWANMYSPVTSDLAQIYMLDVNTGYICGSSGKILKTTNGGITGTEPKNDNYPESFSLYQNYPNPFNPVTKLKFDIKSNIKGEKSIVKIIVFDILGRGVCNLVNEKLNPGTYEVAWDASGFPSGVYFYRLTADDYGETRKMILLK